MLTPRIALVLALAAMVLGLLAIAAFTPATELRGLHADVALYFDVGERLARGEVPYRDFASEYPPLALVPIALARFVPSAQTVDLGVFATRLLVLNTALAAAGFSIVAWLARRDGRRARAAGGLYAIAAVVLGALVIWRFDIFPAVLSAGSLALLVAGRPGLAGLALGAAVAAKLYAAPLAVLFIGWHLVRREWAEAARFTVGFVGVGLVVLAPFAFAGLDLTFLRYQIDRGLQIESIPAGIVGLAHLLGVEAGSNVEFGAVQVDSVLSGPLLAVFGVMAPIAIGLVLVAGIGRLWLARGGRMEMVATLAAAAVATLLAVITTNKALSPQYLIWLLPFLPFLSRGPRLLMIAAAALTVIVFPMLYAGLVALEPIPILLLNIRNALLVATLVWLVVEQWPVARSVTAPRPLSGAPQVRGHAAGEAGH